MKNIFEAIRVNDRETVEFFLKGGVDLTILDNESGNTALELAVSLDFFDLAELLLSYEEVVEKKKEVYQDTTLTFKESALFDCSKSQERFYFLDKILDDSSVYHEHVIIEFSAEFHEETFKNALFELVQRHESLRTQYSLDEAGQIKQEVLYSVDVSVIIADCRQEAVFNIEDLADRELGFIKEKFDLQQAPLWRVKLFFTPMNTCIAFFVFHHIIFDGTSLAVFLGDLISLYQGMLTSDLRLILQRMPNAFQFRQYSRWEKEWIISEDYQKQLRYWHNRLKGYVSQIELYSDMRFNGSAENSKQNGRILTFSFSMSAHERLVAMSKKISVTPFTVYLAAYFILLNKYTQKEDIIIGTPFFNRVLPESNSGIGCFINTLPIRGQLESHKSFSVWVKELSVNVQMDLINGQVPYNDIIKLNVFEKNESQLDALINVFFVYQLGLDFSVEQSTKLKSVSAELKNINHCTPGTVKYPIGIELIQAGQHIHLLINYRCDLYSERFIERLFSHYCGIISSITNNPEISIGDIQLLSLEEKNQQLVGWNHTDKFYPKIAVHKLFEEQVNKAPENIALVFEHRVMTYAELNARANQVAHYLCQQGVGKQPDMLVGLGVERSFEMIIGILAILKAGGAYVPLDPKHPDERLRYLLQDTRVAYLLTQKSLLSRWKNLSENTHSFLMTALDSNDDSFSTMTLSNDFSVTQLNQLAYVIYTSGTTGNPKGVMVEHMGLVNSALEAASLLQIKANTHVLQFASMNFDTMVWEWTSALTQGAVLYLLSPDYPVLEALQHVLEKHPIEVASLTPSVLRALPENCFSSLKSLGVVGESLDNTLFERWRDKCRFINSYGPAEVTVHAAAHVYDKNVSVPAACIGRPIGNTQLYVLDKQRQLVPVGIPSELYIGGVGLARGYLNQQALTEERFIWHQFTSNSTPVRLYRTGDFVRYLSDGQLEYLGRIDHQIKIRGMRVELEEIEAQFLKQAFITHAAVVVKKNSEHSQLIAYLVSPDLFGASTEEKKDFIVTLRKTFSTFLPDYMIPAHMILIEKMPLNVNGKVDRKVLAELVPESLSDNSYVVPKTSTEKQLAILWADVLHLSVDRIGLHENFFALGGHSLLIMRLLSKIRETWKIDISLKSIFGVSTLRKMANVIETCLGHDSSMPILTKQMRPEHIPLSFSQQRLWFLEQLLLGKALYHVPMILTLNGRSNINALKQAYSAMIERHESLRTRFDTVNGEAVQIIELTHKIPELLIHSSTESLEKRIMEPFDLLRGPMIRGELILVNEHESILCIIMHHIITDGVSMEIYFQDFLRFYEHYAHGKPAPTPLSIQYIDYTLWQRNWLQGERFQEQIDYWRHQLSDIPEVILLPTDYPRPKELTYKGGRVNFELSKEILTDINQFAQSYDATVFMVILGALQATLYRYSGQEVIVVGSPIANRQEEQTQSLIGFFVNTLALKSVFNATVTVEELLKQIRTMTLNAYEHQDVPFEQLVTLLNIVRQENVNPLFQVMFAYQEEEINRAGSEDFTVSFVKEVEYPIAKFDLTLLVMKTKAGLHCQIEYSKDLFQEITIKHLVRHFKIILKSMIQAPRQRVNQLSILDAQERHQQLVEWNQTGKSYSQTTITQLFEEQVRKTPGAIALVYEDQFMTYAELNVRSNQVAHYLREQGVGLQPDMLVGLGTERSFEMIIGVLAILKVGAAYVPLDPAHPNDRLRHMLQDTQVQYVLTQSHLTFRWKTLSDEASFFSTIELDKQADYAHFSTENFASVTKLNDLAYVIYTSGSTGKPKGVMITQGSVVNLLLAMNEILTLQSMDSFLALTSMSFDIAGLEWYSPLILGAKIILASQQQVDNSSDLIHLLEKYHPSIMQATPTRWSMLIEAGWTQSEVKILVGGEALNVSLADKLFSQSNHIWNVYGPTETTIWSSCTRFQGDKKISIGKPLANTQFYVLDKDLNLLPIGVIGELYIGGLGLARGYLNRPELTEERFIWHKFSEGSESVRLYKTGDLVRYLPDSNIEYIGRTDDQIKLRGYRIELGEIESQLLIQPAISQAVVLIRKHDTNKQLVAYLVVPSIIESTTEEKQAFIANLKKTLGAFLPEYMIPSYLILVEKMPLNVNGKVDRKVLAELALEALSENNYVSPKTETEKQLAILWADILHFPVEKIGLHENFFALGGHSLLIMRLLSKVRETWQVDISLKSIFGVNTLRQMADVIETCLGHDLRTSMLTKQMRPEHIPLSFSQQRLWFLEQLLPGKALYHVPMVLKLSGQRNVNALKQAYKAMIERHESLRTRFDAVNGEAVQIIEVTHKIPELLIHSSTESLEKRIMEPFDLLRGPMIRGELILVNENESILFIVMHHIITDGVSMEIYFKDFLMFYEHYAHGKLAPMPLSVQYVDYTLWQRNWLKGERFQAQIDYWKHQLSDIPEVMTLPTDYPRPKELTYKGKRVTFELGKEILTDINQFAQSYDATVFMVILGALQTTLYRYSGQEVIVVGSPIANRQEEQTQSLIGFFVNTLALKSVFNANLTVEELLKKIRTMTLNAYEHQDVPFEQLVTFLNITRQANVNPVFQVMFAYQEEEINRVSSEDFTVSFVSEVEYPIAKFDLTLSVIKTRMGLHCQIEYSDDLFQEKTIKHLARHFEIILKNMMQTPHQKINQLSILNVQEKYQQLVEWNQTEKSYSQITITQLFEEQAKRTPNAIALVYEDQSMNYAELNARANQIAYYLREKGVGSQPNMLVGLGAERSFEMIIGILAILKAGGAYVPLDPTYPNERLHYMLQDTKVRYVLTQSHLMSRWEDLSCASCFFVAVALDKSSNYEYFSSENPVSTIQSKDLAYVIYTSGTTGKPKGVMIEHAAIVNTSQESSSLQQITAGSRVLQFFSMNFDAMIWEWTSTLTQGAILYLLSARYSVLDALNFVLEKHSIEVATLTPSVLRMLTRDNLNFLKTLTIAGEALDDILLQRWKNHCRLLNAYGPTETTICASAHIIQLNSNASCIGTPIGNTQLYILDQCKQLLPIGVRGELYIGGLGLARGYLNRSELTEERFIWHKFSEDNPPIRLYRTGDLVRYLPNGNIEYIGRTDHQIKLRGYRIELGEIESQLLAQFDISQAVVLIREHEGNKQLVSYLVAPRIFKSTTEEKQAFIVELKKKLSQFLPEYMIPTYLQLLDVMPLNVNGKVDRKALEALKLEHSVVSEYIAPITETEQQLVILWAQLLQIPAERISVRSSFFELGGHSLLVMQLIYQLKLQFSIEMTVAQFFAAPTIERIADAQKNQINSAIISFSNTHNIHNKPMLFLIHEVSGLATHYRHLLPSLQNDFSLYGINYPYLSEDNPVHYDTLEALAADYILRIKTIAPQGPYYLGGWSMGGNIALEITRQLQENGETVASILLLDTAYQAYKEPVESLYITLFVQDLLTHFNANLNNTNELIRRLIDISAHLYQLLINYQAKPIQPIDKIILVKCQGSLVYLASQKIAQIDWRYVDNFNGLRHYLSNGQYVHLEIMPCHHFELFNEEQQVRLNARIADLLIQHTNEAYEIGGQHYSLVARTAQYVQQGFSIETENYANLTALVSAVMNDEEKSLSPNFQEESEALLTNMLQSKQEHRLNIQQLRSVLSDDKMFIQNIILLLTEISPSYMITATLNLTQKLLVLRLISNQSTELMSALVLDDTFCGIMLQIAQQLTTSLPNYLNIALSRHEHFRVGRAFDAACWLSLTMIIPAIIYAGLSKIIGEKIGFETEITDAWHQLALSHLLAIAPSLLNLCIEKFYHTIYQRYVPVWGGANDMVLTLISVLAFKYSDQLNGKTLGLSLSIGTWTKTFFYMLHLYYRGHITDYHLLRSFPVQQVWYVFKEIYPYVATSFFAFSNYVFLTCLVGAQSNPLSLVGYLVAKSTAEVIQLTSSIMAATSGVLSSRFFLANQYHNVFNTQVISLGLSLGLAVIPAIVLSVISGRELTVLFIDITQIPKIVQDTFFAQVRKAAYYFMGLGVVNAVRTPLSEYLSQQFAYRELQKITFFGYAILANAILAILFFGFHYKNTQDLVKVLFATNIAVTLVMFYQWVKISDFQCLPKQSDAGTVENKKSAVNIGFFGNPSHAHYNALEITPSDDRDHAKVASYLSVE